MSTPGQPGTSVTDPVVPSDANRLNVPNLMPVCFAPDGVIYQPGATYPNAAKWGLNRGSDFGLVCGVAKAGHGVTIRVDSSNTTALAAGTYDFGAGCTLAGYAFPSEIDCAPGVVFTSFPALLQLIFLTIDGDTDSLWTVGVSRRRLDLEDAYLFAGGAAPVIDVIADTGDQLDVFATGAQCFFDEGSLKAEDGAIVNLHLSGGASFGDGAFSKVGAGQIFLFIEDWQSAAALIENNPDLSVFDVVENDSGQMNLSFAGASTFGLVTQAGQGVGPWRIGFPLAVSLDTAVNLAPGEEIAGTWEGTALQPVTLTTVTGIQIVPPEVFTLRNLSLNAQAGDVSVFAPPSATRFVLDDGTLWEGNTGKAAILNVLASTIQTIELRRGSSLQANGNGAVFIANTGTLIVDAWEGSTIVAGAIGRASGEGVTTTLEIDVRGEGCVIDPSYGADIHLFPGVLFAASGDPVTVGVTPTDVGCLYLDSGTGIEWTYDGEVWKQVNPQIVTNAIPLADLQAGGAASTLIKDLTGILPADTKVSSCEIQVVTPLAAAGLVGVTVTMQSSAGDVDGSLASAGSAGAIPAAGFYTGGTNPYPSRGGATITAKIVLTGGALFSGLTAGSLTFRLLKQVLPDG